MGSVGIAAVATVQLGIATLSSWLIFPFSETRKYFWTEFTRSSIDGLTDSDFNTKGNTGSFLAELGLNRRNVFHRRQLH